MIGRNKDFLQNIFLLCCDTSVIVSVLYLARKQKAEDERASKRKNNRKRKGGKNEKAVALVLVIVMMLAFGATAFAAGPLTLEQAKQTALNYVGVKANEAAFTKECKDFENGREVYEIEFFANSTEYDMDVDVYTGTITNFSSEYYGTYSQPSYSAPYGYYYDDDPYDWDDRFDCYDYDDVYDGVYTVNGIVVYDD